MLNLANILTLVRLACAAPIVLLILAGRYEVAFWVFMAAALSDAADGFVAKRFNGCTPVGAVLDPAADKILIVSLFLALLSVEALPLWLVVLAIVRELVLVGGTALLRYRLRDFRVEPLVVGKLTTLVQLSLAGFVLGQLGGIAEVGAALAVLVPLTAVITVVSAIAYVGAGLRLSACARTSP
ncbi:CDP-alcohol phosphatidyltransferase family protein [Marinimicrococcus flavescens]|uniref:CDP-diacylglycerol--glycerol-3-phosphate 3-phosphatidyltransferase n=1 Tax=Marinimicrococcus flavescens TaxID=3031815 RepID=A0AAP3UZG7_9PROT|nr:CDP-alcohol phosphatidyltransferase family protein [Marinimicrococcus flavescens]